jgi:hypothetical protein
MAIVIEGSIDQKEIKPHRGKQKMFRSTPLTVTQQLRKDFVASTQT